MNKKERTALAVAILMILFVAILLMNANSISSVFVDVPSDAWYAEAVEWAAAEGITNGTDATHFSPDKVCTRAEMVTFLHRLAESMAEPTPEPTQEIPKPPAVSPTIHPEYADCYVGRMHIGEDYSVGLYETLDQALVDMSDTAFMYMVHGDTTFMIGDHDYEGLWLIRYLNVGDTMWIEYTDGTVETYEMQGRDPHVRNTGYDVLDADGKSLFHKGYDIFIATCNDSEGREMTATFWRRMQNEDSQSERASDLHG